MRSSELLKPSRSVDPEFANSLRFGAEERVVFPLNQAYHRHTIFDGPPVAVAIDASCSQLGHHRRDGQLFRHLHRVAAWKRVTTEQFQEIP